MRRPFPWLCLLLVPVFAVPALAQRIPGPPAKPGAYGVASSDSPVTRAQAIAIVVAGGKVYGCPTKADWYSESHGTCPNSKQPLQRIIAIKDGHALFEHGGFAGLHETPSIAIKP